MIFCQNLKYRRHNFDSYQHHYCDTDCPYVVFQKSYFKYWTWSWFANIPPSCLTGNTLTDWTMTSVSHQTKTMERRGSAPVLLPTSSSTIDNFRLNRKHEEIFTSILSSQKLKLFSEVLCCCQALQRHVCWRREIFIAWLCSVPEYIYMTVKRQAIQQLNFTAWVLL